MQGIASKLQLFKILYFLAVVSQNMWDGKAMSVHEFLNVTRRYPPDLQDAAVQTVLQQAEALSAEWAQ